MTTRQKIIAANWKMNVNAKDADALLAEIVPAVTNIVAEIIIVPPFPYLAQLQTATANSAITSGAQNVNNHEQGAFTGEVSTTMLSDFGVQYVIVGHSERRTLYGEDDALIADKTAAVINAGLTPILCVGETLPQRQQNQAENVIENQLSAVIDKVGIEAFANIIIAYEPVWAIGTGQTATKEQAQAIHGFIRHKLANKNQSIAGNISIIYGGSVNADNAGALFACNDIDGGLIGGAALDAASFITICKS